jgi:hypothetical protein
MVNVAKSETNRNDPVIMPFAAYEPYASIMGAPTPLA